MLTRNSQMGVPVTALKGASEKQATGSRDIKRVLDPSGEATLEELMTAYVQGNAEAFDQLYQRISAKLFGYLLRLTRNKERAEDLLQITFSKIHRARASYMFGAPLLPWVLAIARRSFYDERRSARTEREELSPDGNLPEPARQDDAGLADDIGEALELALNEMPEAYREAIQLTKITGLSLAEAAQVLGTTPTAVKLRVHRGYSSLRKAMEAYDRGKP